MRESQKITQQTRLKRNKMKLKTLMEKINKIKRKSEIFTQQHKSTTEK